MMQTYYVNMAHFNHMVKLYYRSKSHLSTLFKAGGDASSTNGLRTIRPQIPRDA
jgi:hypothetical protein